MNNFDTNCFNSLTVIKKRKIQKDNIILNFKKNILPQIIKEYNPKELIIFGCRGKGTYTLDSDLDVIIVSKTFQNIPFIERMPLLLKKFDFPRHIASICYTPEEFERIKDNSILMSY